MGSQKYYCGSERGFSTNVYNQVTPNKEKEDFSFSCIQQGIWLRICFIKSHLSTVIWTSNKHPWEILCACCICERENWECALHMMPKMPWRYQIKWKLSKTSKAVWLKVFIFSYIIMNQHPVFHVHYWVLCSCFSIYSLS